MRTYTSANITVTYPEQLVWLLDNNFMLCENMYGAYRMRVNATVTVGGVHSVYDHTTEIGTLTFRWAPFLRGVPNGSNVGVVCSITTWDANDNQHSDVVKYTMDMRYGKTLQERHHCSESVVVYEKAPDLVNFEILKPAGWTGRVYFGANTYTYNSNDASVNLITYASPGDMTIKYSGLTGIYRGEIFNDGKDAIWSVRCLQVCPAKNGIKLTYYNTDGCKRYAIGEVLKKTMAAERKECRKGGIVYDEPPRSLVTGYTGTIDVGFKDVEPGQYLEDIMLSPVVTTARGTDTINVIPTTLQMVRDGETKDIIITFKIDA